MATLDVIIGVLGTALFTLLGALGKMALARLTRMERHLDSIAGSHWMILWRLTGVEDFLSDELKYRPPRLVGEAGGRDPVT